MFSAKTYTERRQALAKRIGSGLIFLPGNKDVGMNYSANVYHFRQDSNFLYYIGIDQPNLAAIIDCDNGETTLYGDELTMDDIVWTGPQPSLAAQGAQSGIQRVVPMSELKGEIDDRKFHFAPPYRAQNSIWLSDLRFLENWEVKSHASTDLIEAIVAQRSYKTAEEIEEIEKAVRLTNQMHLTAMRYARPGMKESEVHAAVQQTVHAADSHTSFPVILTVHGETLHNHHHSNTLESGQLVLCDCGGESPMHYAGDMTRTFPVDPTFSNRQKDVYNVVLQSQLDAIATLKPGTLYRDSHLTSARTIAQGMKDLGLMKGDVDEAVAAGAHALFFQHGLGHMMGIDVHDMEDLGENHVGYGNGLERSEQFGLGFLRLARALEPGFVITVEPGIYFIPQLIDQWAAEKKFADFVNYDAVAKFKDFGGIRIEDDYLITDSGARLLGDPVAKTVEDVERERSA